MFRRRGASNGSLPTTSGNAPSPSIFHLPSTSSNDGSARSIHLQNPLVTKWKRSPRAVKICYSVALVSFVIAVMGWRTISYYAAKIYIDCTTQNCTFAVRGRGRSKTTTLTIPRHQLLGAKAVKVNADGKIVNDNVNINEEWKYEVKESTKGKKKSSKSYNNYKGPDKDGNYLTYVVRLKDKSALKAEEEEEEEKRKHQEAPQAGETPQTVKKNDENKEYHEFGEEPAVDLANILHFAVSADNVAEQHIVMRQHGINQQRRRVRTMIQKIDSYAKKRRHKLAVKESTSPDWRGVLMIVLGGCAFLLSLLLGMFWEDEESSAQATSGPGARKIGKGGHGHGKNPTGSSSSGGPSKNVNPYQRTTPSRYEVSTMPRKPGAISVRRRN